MFRAKKIRRENVLIRIVKQVLDQTTHRYSPWREEGRFTFKAFQLAQAQQITRIVGVILG